MIIHTKSRQDRKAEYAEFLKSRFWFDLRRMALNKFGYRCFKCHNKQHLQAHHTHYRADWYQTELSDLVVLCRACHRQQHDIDKPVRPLIHPTKAKKNKKRARFIRKQNRLRKRFQWSF